MTLGRDHLIHTLSKLGESDGGPLESRLQLVTDVSLGVLRANHASIRLCDEAQPDLEAYARSGVDSERPPPPFRRGEGILGWVVEHGVTARVGESDRDPRFRAKNGYEVRSVMSVPLLSAGKVVGVLSFSAPDRHAFDATDERIGSLLASFASMHVRTETLERLAITDHQTLAFNRRYLPARLREELARAKRTGCPLSLLLCDLDRFKQVNDRHGHAVGDRVLRAFADTVREHVRTTDVLVRRGGEEFVLLMPQTAPHDALLVAERIRTALASKPLDLELDTPLHQTVSIGVATWPGDESAEAFEERADRAMYAAKHGGRNRVVVAI